MPKKTSVDDYIVRIKRREQSGAREIVGLVEVVETQTRYPFHSFEELRRILVACPVSTQMQEQSS